MLSLSNCSVIFPLALDDNRFFSSSACSGDQPLALSPVVGCELNINARTCKHDVMSGNVKLNPGPMNKRQKCEKMMPTRSNNCKCVICYTVLPRGFCTLVHLFTL